MGLATRIRRITVARIEEFLSSAEDPERLMPQLVREMEDQVRAATSAEAMAMASVKAAQRDEEELKTRVKRYAAGAQQAMTQGDEATAREALTAQIKLEADLARKEEGRARAEITLEDARESRKQIQAQLEDLRVKKDQIMTRAKVAHNRGLIEKSVSGHVTSSGSILDAVSRMEAKVDQSEAEISVRREMTKEGTGARGLDKRLEALERDANVETRLAALKAKGGAARKA